MKAQTDKSQSTRLARIVIDNAESIPADLALRNLFREKNADSDLRREVSQAVFAYYRWFGWIRRTITISARIDAALELDARFQISPESFTDDELAANAVPDWARDMVEFTPDRLRELQAQPPLWLRARPGTGEAVADALEDAVLHPDVPDAIRYIGERDLFGTPEFREGQFEIQDLSSQMVGHLCAPKPAETWWDACAGEGGKMLHLAGLMQNKGLIWATDRSKRRLERLKTRASRAKVFNYRVKLWPELEHLPVKSKFDGILLDAPCSGIGTWGRNPQARWTTLPQDVEELAAIQERLLNRVAGSLKPGGRLVYSVCTLARLETTGVAEKFSASAGLEPLTLGSRWGDEKENIVWLWPEQVNANGMFIAAWRKP